MILLSLVEQILLLAVVGLLTAMILAGVLFRFKQKWVTITLLLGGLFSGMLGALVWIFATNGLEDGPLMIIPPVVITLICSFIIVKYLKVKVSKKGIFKVRNLSFVFIISLVFLMAISMLPLAHPDAGVKNGINIKGTPDELRVSSGDMFLTEDQVEKIMDPSTSSLDIGIDVQSSSVKFPRILANPQVGDTIDFEIVFSVSDESWVYPYVKFCVFHDADGDETYDAGETLWQTADFCINEPGSGSGSFWRTHLWYDLDDEPWHQMSVVGTTEGTLIMPVFNLETNWGAEDDYMDDQDKYFLNTPDEHRSPRDQLSWEQTGPGEWVFREGPDQGSWYWFRELTSSSQEHLRTLYGRVYCDTWTNDKDHCLWIQVFDMNQQVGDEDPYDMSLTPINQAFKQFHVGGGELPVISIDVVTWVSTMILGVATAGATVTAASKFNIIKIV